MQPRVVHQGVEVLQRAILFALTAVLGFAGIGLSAEPDRPLLTLAVMDPLAAPLACPCVQGYAQRRYERLAEYLEGKLGCRVQVAFGEDLESVVKQQATGRVDLVIGKDSVVRYDADQLHLKVRPLASLTGKDGTTTQYGLFVVPAGDTARTLADLKGYQILFGPVEAEEKHAAAMAALVKAGVPLPTAEKLATREACSDGACEILDEDFKQSGVAVISSYAQPLLEGCGTIDQGSLRIVGRTADVPFVTAFAVDSVDDALRARIQAALLAAGDDSEMRTALETRNGFVAYADEKKK